MRLIAAIITLIFGATPSAIGGITVSPDGRSVSLRGMITSDDVAVFADAINNSEGLVYIMLDSKGGDVDAAIAMGRLARKHSVFAAVPAYGRCESSCVLVLVGATKRFIFGQVGLHRPYFIVRPDANPLNQDDIMNMFQKVRHYLQDMNISEQIYDIMMNTPPERMKVFSMQQEGNAVHSLIPEDDPVAAEQEVVYAARQYRLDTLSYRELKSKADRLCVSDDVLVWINCQEALLWGLDVSIYLTRRQVAEDRCSLSEESYQEIRAFDGEPRDHPAYLAMEQCRQTVFGR